MTGQVPPRQRTPRSWVIWACPKCDYYRCDQARGVHMTSDPANPNGAMIEHRLVEVEVVRKDQP